MLNILLLDIVQLISPIYSLNLIFIILFIDIIYIYIYRERERERERFIYILKSVYSVNI